MTLESITALAVSILILLAYRRFEDWRNWHKYQSGKKLDRETWRKQHAKYLKTKRWREFSQATRRRRGKCEVKGCFVAGWSNLETHHLHYNSLGRETAKDVRVLCGIHHTDTHNGIALKLRDGTTLKPFGGKS